MLALSARRDAPLSPLAAGARLVLPLAGASHQLAEHREDLHTALQYRCQQWSFHLLQPHKSGRGVEGATQGWHAVSKHVPDCSLPTLIGGPACATV